jgi:hypothetical protein
VDAGYWRVRKFFNSRKPSEKKAISAPEFMNNIRMDARSKMGRTIIGQNYNN